MKTKESKKASTHTIASAQSAGKQSAAKVAFETVVEEGIAWIAWINEASKFEALLKDKIPWADLEKDEKNFIERRLRIASPSSQMMVNSFYITMVAGFEEYLREIIREIANKVSHSRISFENLSENLRRAHIREAAKLLRRIDSPPDYIKLDEIELCRQIGSCIPGSKAVEINGNALAEMEGLLKLDTFMERLGLLGKPLSWDYLGSEQLIKKSLEMESLKSRAVGNALAEELTTISRYRNRIAHTGGHAADVTPQIAEDHRKILSALATTIDKSVAN